MNRIKKALKKADTWTQEHAELILGLGVGGAIASILAIRAVTKTAEDAKVVGGELFANANQDIIIDIRHQNGTYSMLRFDRKEDPKE